MADPRLIEPHTLLPLQYPHAQALWEALHEHMRARLDYLRATNDTPRPPSEEYRANMLRGQIEELKQLLALEPQAPGPADEGGPE